MKISLCFVVVVKLISSPPQNRRGALIRKGDIMRGSYKGSRKWAGEGHIQFLWKSSKTNQRSSLNYGGRLHQKKVDKVLQNTVQGPQSFEITSKTMTTMNTVVSMVWIVPQGALMPMLALKWCRQWGWGHPMQVRVINIAVHRPFLFSSGLDSLLLVQGYSRYPSSVSQKNRYCHLAIASILSAHRNICLSVKGFQSVLL